MMNHYSISEMFKNIYSFILTKIFYKKCRLIRRPVYVRGRKSLAGAEGLTTGRFCRFDLDGKKKTLFVGKNCQFGDNTHIVALSDVKIGDNVLIASKVFISDTSHGKYKGNNQDSPTSNPNSRRLTKGYVKIGNNVWIGENSVLLQGAEVGDGCVIGANSIITKKIPDNCMVVKNNMIIKKYNDISLRWEQL